MKAWRLLWIVVILGLALLWLPVQVRAAADEYDDSQSNPLRIVGYMGHPFGVLMEWVIFRPLHALVSANPTTEYISGHRPHPPLFEEALPVYDPGISRRVSVPARGPRRMARVEAPTAERVSVKEVQVTVEKTVVQEVPKIVEVEKVVFPDIAFQFNSARLSDLGRGKAYLVAQRLKEKTDVTVVIEGHADYVGSEEYNQRLGQRRAETVQKELEQLGVEPARMSILSFGETRPLIAQETDWARAVNRRVEFGVKAR